MESSSKSQQQYDDEIDLVELVEKLWKEKISITLVTIIFTALGLLYATLSTPVYQASIQLIKPTTADLTYLNTTTHFAIDPDSVFTQLLETLDSDQHLSSLINQKPDDIKATLGISTDPINIEKLKSIRKVEFPNTTKKTNQIQPDKYYLTYEGVDQIKLEKLILSDVQLSQKLALEKIEENYKSTLENIIHIMEKDRLLNLNNLEDELNSRKNLVLSLRKDKLRQLQEALKIANTLNIIEPTSITKLASSNNNRQVEINADFNNQNDPLYLRGSKLLAAEIENLANLDEDSFFDRDIREIEAKKIILANNRELEQLKITLESFKEMHNTRFYSNTVNQSSTPIKPQKNLIMTISILLGAISGLLVAICRIVYKNHKKKELL